MNEPCSSDGFGPGNTVSTDASRKGFLELGYSIRRAKDSEHLGARWGLHRQPYLPAGSHPGYIPCGALPKGVGAATLKSVRHEADDAVTGGKAASCEAPSVPAGGSNGEHTGVIGRSGLAL